MTKLTEEKVEVDNYAGEPESFYAKIINIGGSSNGVIIDAPILKVNGWDTNTTLKVWVKKVAQKKERD